MITPIIIFLDIKIGIDDNINNIEKINIMYVFNCNDVVWLNKYSIFDRTVEKDGILESTIANKKGMIVFSPLAQGLLTNRYLKGIPGAAKIKEVINSEQNLENVKEILNKTMFMGNN